MIEKAYRIFSGIWLGGIVFFSIILAPLIFRYLPKATAADLQNHLFPAYYMVGAICGFIIFTLDFFRAKKKLYWIALAITLAIVGFSVLSPLIRTAFVEQSAAMSWLHPLAVALNLIMLLSLLIAI